MTTKIDTWDSTMSMKETVALLDAATIEFEKGNEEEGDAILMKIPLAPELAMCLATQVGIGPEALKVSGLNLKDAEAKYGTDWLERIYPDCQGRTRQGRPAEGCNPQASAKPQDKIGKQE